jgi:hypothetical protein
LRQKEQRIAKKAAASVKSVPEVIAALKSLQTVQDKMPNPSGRDGVACFTSLYTQITEAVLAGINEDSGAPKFDNPGFIQDLDIVFARRYFSALASNDPPLAWGVLIDRRASEGISEIQFAASGVNAHVNFDLPIAVVCTCDANRLELDEEPQRESYQQVNDIFDAQMQGLIKEFETGAEAELDVGVVADLADRLGDDAVRDFRDLAWTHALRLSSLDKEAARTYKHNLDRLTSLAGRGILFRDPLAE